MSPKTRAWTQRGPNVVAAFTPAHAAAGRGAFHRFGPTGGAAYGMPRYCRTPAALDSAPLTRPASVLTGAWADAARGSVSAARATAIATCRTCATVQAMRNSPL